ncbi:putative protein [Arabidopsis thaliana]|nr:putative protein [Arabidopsis thaliana]
MRCSLLTPTSYRFHYPNPFRSLESIPPLSNSRYRIESGSPSSFKFSAPSLQRHSSVSVKAFDDDTFDFYTGDIFAATYAISSSEGEESDGDYALNVVTETTAQKLGKFPRDRLRVHEPIRTLGPVPHNRRPTIPTMGGLFFVPIGVVVAIALNKVSSIEVLGAAAATVAFAAIGLIDDSLSLYNLSVFGASMAGACFGFLLHNRYRASVSMGDTGSLALGGALAAMAACSGMFFPLFISSGVAVLEASSVIIQVVYYSTTKRLKGKGRRIFKTIPFHHHLRLNGLKEPMIVTMAYVISSLLSLSAAYIGLISA